MPLQWRNQLWQSSEESAGKRWLECELGDCSEWGFVSVCWGCFVSLGVVVVCVCMLEMVCECVCVCVGGGGACVGGWFVPVWFKSVCWGWFVSVLGMVCASVLGMVCVSVLGWFL